MEFRHSLIEGNSAELRPGGAFYGYNGALLSMKFSQLSTNRGVMGGAIHLEAACMAKLDHVHFQANTALIRGGGISTIMASVDMASCTFAHNQAAALGAQVYLEQPVSVKILDTEFDPFVDGGQAVFFGGRLAGCTEHPCDPGFSCAYEKYSLM
jgi:hypothetical protein